MVFVMTRHPYGLCGKQVDIFLNTEKSDKQHQTLFHFVSILDKATEVTLQPIKRYNFDASIIFSDILLIPWAMNRNVHFIPGKGPVLDKLDTVKDIEIFAETDLSNKYKAVGEAVQKTRQNLPESTALIGFSGAPWTLMTYLLAGKFPDCGNKILSLVKPGCSCRLYRYFG